MECEAAYFCPKAIVVRESQSKALFPNDNIYLAFDAQDAGIELKIMVQFPKRQVKSP
jgi:hypothetical protein